MELDYKTTYVTYPEGVGKQLEDKSNEGIPDRERLNKLSDGNGILFLRNDYLIQTFLRDHKIPDGLCSEIEVQEKMVKPIIHKVTNDLEKIDDLLPELRKLHNNGKISDTLTYERQEYNGNFKIYDSMYREDIGIFEKTAKLKGLPKELLKKEFENLPEIARWIAVDRSGFHTGPFVYDLNFKKAVERVLRIYNLSDKIKNISFDICEKRNFWKNLERI